MVVTDDFDVSLLRHAMRAFSFRSGSCFERISHTMIDPSLGGTFLCPALES